eukprot:6178993-Pyramimonas_sp.AAC.1
MKGDTTPKDALSLVGNDAQELLRDPGRFIERPPNHDDSRGVPPRPCMDPGPRGNSLMLRELVSRLHFVRVCRVPQAGEVIHWPLHGSE